MWGPCEDVSILTEELDELAFLFAVEPGPNDDALARVEGVEGNTLAVLVFLKHSLIIRSLGLRARHRFLHLSLGYCYDLVELAPFCIDDHRIGQPRADRRTFQ